MTIDRYDNFLFKLIQTTFHIHLGKEEEIENFQQGIEQNMVKIFEENLMKYGEYPR